MEQKVLEAKEALINKLRAQNPKAKFAHIERAFDIAYKAHQSQFRASGEPYILHPLAVANIISDLHVDSSSIITALLHDTVEDTDVSIEQIETEFNKEIAKLVDGVTKLTKIENQPENIKQAENFRKLLLAISKDIRVLIVKLADRVHNMRTLNYMESKEKRLRIAHETMEIYAPLAERIGIHKFKNELQDLAFAELHPEIRASILGRLAFLRKEGVPLIEIIVNEITKILNDEGIKSEVCGREKTSYSIWSKMERKNVPFELLSDIMAFRVIVDDVRDCYHALGVMHSKYHVIPGSFKDYISTPKVNGYQSLHTIVMGPEKRCIEIQIRTHKMHEVAELGLAAHWTYKQMGSAKHQGTQFRWIRELLSILENASSPEEFLENTKLEMYYDQVFCFTPKGDLIALPKSATPIDFAFAVHSTIGLSCIGARVNGRIVPLKTQLENGDQVEILRSKNPIPSPTWEKIVVTGKAKTEIRKFIKAKQREEYINLGRALLNKTFEQEGKEYKESLLQDILEKFHQKSIEDLLSSVGDGLISRHNILKELYPSPLQKKSLNPLSLLRFRPKTTKTPTIKSLPIKGLIPGMAVHFASCCHPLPGDKIVGIVNTGKGITIHTVACEILDSFSSTPERWIDVSWDGVSDETYIGRLKLVVSNAPGTLAEITSCIAGFKINITNFKLVGRSLDFFEILLDLEVVNTQQLGDIIYAIRTLSCIHSISRTKI